MVPYERRVSTPACCIRGAAPHTCMPTANAVHFQTCYSSVMAAAWGLGTPDLRATEEKATLLAPSDGCLNIKHLLILGVQADLEWEMKWLNGHRFILLHRKQAKITSKKSCTFWTGIAFCNPVLDPWCLSVWGLVMQYPKCVRSENISTENRGDIWKNETEFYKHQMLEERRNKGQVSLIRVIHKKIIFHWWQVRRKKRRWRWW